MDIVGLVLAVIIVLVSISGAGLNKKLSKIHTQFSIAIFGLAFLTFIYYLFNDFIQIFAIPFIIVIVFVPLYVILWLVQLYKNSKEATNKSEPK